MKIIKHALLISLAVFITSKIIAGIHTDPVSVVFIVGSVLTIINFTIKPIIKILTLPINIITLGTFSIFLNASIFWLVGKDNLINGFSIDTWISALYGSIIISIITWLGDKMFGSKED